MKTSPADARILVATANAGDAREVAHKLRAVFSSVRESTSAEAAVADFDECKPDVLVLAFETLERSESYYLGLYRASAQALQEAHRTVVLCGKEQVATAFALCQKNHFDDYVLYWPHSYDGTRLAMSVWIACRDKLATRDRWPDHAEMVRHAGDLVEIDRVVADPAERTAQELRARLEPALAATRELVRDVRQRRPHVLVVEDDEFSRQLVQQALDPACWEVFLAADGADALAQMRRSKPDLILMDIRLPGIDGVALTRRLKAMPHLANIPIIMMTGDARRETLLRSVEAGATAFVVKPVSRSSLQPKLDKIFPR